jgi:hypothetical protein
MKMYKKKGLLEDELYHEGGHVDDKRTEAYSGGMYRKKYAEGGSLLSDDMETHTMPDGTEMAGATHGESDALLPDEEMEEDHSEFILDEALSEEEQDMLMSKLEQDEELQLLFDKVVGVAQEFAGSGPVDGLGTGVSDSIPARLSDGEFVFTAKAVAEIGEDVLMSMMKEAEAGVDNRQELNVGGMLSDPKLDVDPNGQPVEGDMVEDEIRKGMLSANPRLRQR